MLNHIPVPPFFSLRTVVIRLQTLVTFGSIFLCKEDGVMPRYVSYETLPKSVQEQGKGRCMEQDTCKPEWP